MLKIVLHYDVGPEFALRLGRLEETGLEIAVCPVADRDRFALEMRDADVLWHYLEPVTVDVIEASPRLRLIQKIGVGVNTIDLEAARNHDVRVCNMPGTNSQAVAEASLALMFATLRRLVSFDAAMRRGDGWRWNPALQDELFELGGRCVGLVGYGSIPRILAPVLDALGAEVIYYARRPKADAIGKFCALPELLARADVISLHLPLDAQTHHIIDAKALAMVKSGAILINTARGGLVDETALIEALERGPLRAAGLDTFEQEPTPADNPLLHLDNVVLMPHVAWLTTDTLDRSLVVAVENCRRLVSDEALLHQVV